MMNNAENPQLTIPRVIGCLSFFNADNLEIMRGFKDDEFDLAIVDPPYGLERFKKANEETTGVYAKRGSWKHKGEKNWNNEKPSDEYWQELFRISKNQIIWGANNFELPPSEYFCVWDKVQYIPNFASAEYAWVSMGLKKPAKVFRYEIHKENALRKADGGKVHPTQKPIQLYDFILKNYALPNQRILDTHLGSGSIAIAVEKANRLDKMNIQFVGIEIDKEYYEAALNRIEQYCRQGTLSF